MSANLAPAPVLTIEPAKRNFDWYVFGLTMACPIHQDNPRHCPLYPIRARTLVERVAWVAALSEQQAQEIVSVHESCAQHHFVAAHQTPSALAQSEIAETDAVIGL